MLFVKYFFLIFVFCAIHHLLLLLSCANAKKNVTMELSKFDPKIIKFEVLENCSSITLCYHSVLYGRKGNFTWKIARRFRADKLFNGAQTDNGDGNDECGKNANKVQISISDTEVVVANQIYKLKAKSMRYKLRDKPTQITKIELKLHKIHDKFLLINDDEQTNLHYVKEFIAHSKFGAFLEDYAGLWLLAADLFDIFGPQKSTTKITLLMADKCELKPIKVSNKCRTFEYPMGEIHSRHLPAQQEMNINPLISGGYPIDDINHMPWTVYFDSGGSCTGSLISHEFVLLAAHCFVNIPQGNKIYLGFNSSSRDLFNKYYDGFSVNIVRTDNVNVFIHPKFDPTKLLAFDLALIKLKNINIAFAAKIQSIAPICLQCGPADELRSGNAYAAGWGLLTNSCNDRLMAHETPMQLQGRTVELLECPAAGSGITTDVSKEIICIEGNTIQKGDSGSALLASNGTEYVQVGTLSALACTITGKIYASFYARLDVCWIEQITGIPCAN